MRAISKAICPKTEDLKNSELNALPFYGGRYIKTKIRTYGDKVCTNFCGLNVPDDDIDCGSFTVISINSLLVFNEKYIKSVQAYPMNPVLMNIFLKIKYYK